MKKKVIIAVLIFALVMCTTCPFRQISYADALTAFQIGACAFAVAPGLGISFSTQGQDGYSIDAISGLITEYTYGSDIASKFGSDMMRLVAGKLIIPAQLYNGISEFWDWVKSTYNIGAQLSSINEMVNDVNLNRLYEDSVNLGAYSTYHGITSNIYYEDGWIDTAGYKFTASGLQTNQYDYSGYRITRMNDGRFRNTAYYNHKYVGTMAEQHYDIAIPGAVYQSMKASAADPVLPTVLNPNQSWSGTIEGAPDTNLDQLLGSIYDNIDINILDVDAEIIDVPIPPPTPGPIDPDTPLSDVPWEGLDTNLQDLYNQGLEEIGAIGDAQDAIIDAVAEQTGALEGAIADNAGVVSGAIDQAVSDVQTAIGEQTAALDDSLSATAEGVETIVDAIEDEEINWQKFDLRGLFPFCIPFDIYNMLEALDASPTAPHVQLPFVIDSINFSYTIDLDFSAFDQVAAVMRQMELIVYGIALAWATSKVIKW